nr:RNA-directed DNA polymerase, eukaryota, reverse transcriptase zinc-binding domain protein [Tanacetum cinerariifolium]
MGHGSAPGSAHSSFSFDDYKDNSPAEEVSPVKPKKPSKRVTNTKKDDPKEGKEAPKEWTVAEEIALCQACSGINLNEEADEVVQETQEFRPMGRDQAKAKKKAAGSSSGGSSSFVDFLKREKLEIQRPTLELAEREKRNRDILFNNSKAVFFRKQCRSAANVFNAFIDDARLFEPVLGGRNFTWMNKAGTKMSKLDRFLISQHVTDVFTDVKVTALPRGCGTGSMIEAKMAYNECSTNYPLMPFHEKLKVIKQHIKNWTHRVKNVEIDRKQEIISNISDIEAKIDSNTVLEVEKEDRMKLLKERDDLQQLEDMDVVQKSKVKWDVEGDENKNFTEF